VKDELLCERYVMWRLGAAAPDKHQHRHHNRQNFDELSSQSHGGTSRQREREREREKMKIIPMKTTSKIASLYFYLNLCSTLYMSGDGPARNE